jgi:UDPglucose--hexose-1-phosphate uridylyltransferase
LTRQDELLGGQSVDTPEPGIDAAQAPALFPHRRKNALTGEWVLVSPQRASRPWLGQVEAIGSRPAIAYDASCSLCPRNERASGARNPDYGGVYVFDNDFPALLPSAALPSPVEHDLLAWSSQPGACRVLCFSPRHDLTLAEMPVDEIRAVVDIWAAQTEELGRIYRWVQVFENKGEMMGSSNPHPHGQVWASSDLPTQAAREDAHQGEYLFTHRRRLLVDYAALELDLMERVVVQNEHWLVVVPFWAEWPFETLLMPRNAVQRLPDLDDRQRQALASIIKKLLVRYDNLFGAPFPYSMGWHGAPYPHGDDDSRVNGAHWQLHCHFYPPLLRSSSVRKFQVGYELLAEAQRDLTPEKAAEVLRCLPDTSCQWQRSAGE